jgi:omega-6 fatty acid desaturase (delta-12 desaturase)
LTAYSSAPEKWYPSGAGGEPSRRARAAAGAGSRVEHPYWREALAPYARPRLGRSLLDLATSAVPYLALSVAMYLAVSVSYVLVLVIAVPAAGFLVRTFIVFHDCSHGSFLPSKRANARLGVVLGLLVYSPFLRWRHDHAIHHATSGDLDRRGGGDVRTLTVAEYLALPWKGRLGYRLFRNPLLMFGLGPIVALLVGPRLVARGARPRLRRSVIATNIALAMAIGALCWAVGWRDFLLVQGPTIMLAGAAGIWLFYVQHQFEDAYWQGTGSWSYADAALRGSSYLKLPKVLQFFSGNIGLHHVHHLNARIPNYNLQRAHDETPMFHDVPTLSLWDGLRAVRLKLWDEQRGRLVTLPKRRTRRYPQTGVWMSVQPRGGNPVSTNLLLSRPTEGTAKLRSIVRRSPARLRLGGGPDRGGAQSPTPPGRAG